MNCFPTNLLNWGGVFNMSDFGFIDPNEADPELVEVDAPEADYDNPPKTKLGDLYRLGKHYLL